MLQAQIAVQCLMNRMLLTLQRRWHINLTVKIASSQKGSTGGLNKL